MFIVKHVRPFELEELLLIATSNLISGFHEDAFAAVLLVDDDDDEQSPMKEGRGLIALHYLHTSSSTCFLYVIFSPNSSNIM